MNWIQLKDENTLKDIKSESAEKPVVIFKHSTRCSISAAALGRLERNWNAQEMTDIKFYFLDVITNRQVSQKVEDVFDVVHESPQLLIISNGNCIFHNSHMSIGYPEIKNQLNKLSLKN